MLIILHYKQHDKFNFPPFPRFFCRALTCSIFSFHTLLHCSVIQSASQRHALLFCWLLIFKIGFSFSFCRQIQAEKKVKFWHRLINWVCVLNKWGENPQTLPVSSLPYYRRKEILPSSDPSSLLSLGGFGDYLHHTSFLYILLNLWVYIIFSQNC